jgi:hypothetical protein
LLELVSLSSYSRIGDIFDVKKDTISNHLSEIGWSSQALRQQWTLMDIQVAIVSAFIMERFDGFIT